MILSVRCADAASRCIVVQLRRNLYSGASPQIVSGRRSEGKGADDSGHYAMLPGGPIDGSALSDLVGGG
jgi:hypothetical protein